MLGSGITAEEKFKKLKDGSVNRHIYYKCTKVRDGNCKNEPISEVDLIKQFEKLVDTIDLNEIGMKDKIKIEVERFKKFQKMLLGQTDKIEIQDIDLRNFAKFTLKEGKNTEKRDLLECLRSKIILKNKKIETEITSS